MENRLQKDMDKPWENEPNLISLEGEGYHLLIVRNPHLKTLCGYVGVTRQHPWFLSHYDDKKLRNIWVHGGLTFSQKGGVSHFKKKYWYFGFDCAHAGDLVPSMQEVFQKTNIAPFSLFKNEVYRDIDYVQDEVRNLLEQLKDAKKKRGDYKHNFVREYRKLSKLKKNIRG
jgi:hypothetical protein